MTPDTMQYDCFASSAGIDLNVQMITSVRVRELSLLLKLTGDGVNPSSIHPIVVSVELLLDGDHPIHAAETVNPRSVVVAAEAIADSPAPSVETFAQRLSRRCMDWTHVNEVRIAVDQPFALARGIASVEVTAFRPG